LVLRTAEGDAFEMNDRDEFCGVVVLALVAVDPDADLQNIALYTEGAVRALRVVALRSAMLSLTTSKGRSYKSGGYQQM
jgi:hypothetical protein